MKRDFLKVAEQIDAIGRNVATFYEPVVADMHQVRMKARQFETLASDLKMASEPPGKQPAAKGNVTILDAAAGLRDAIGEAQIIVTDDDLHTVLQKMQSQCDKLLLFSKELNSLSFLMLVTTASATASGFTVEHLVGELREMAKQLKSASFDIVGTLSLIDGVRQRTGKVLGDTCAHIDKSLKHLDAATDAPDLAPQAAPGSRTPDLMAEDLSQDLAKLLPGLVACMQHPDAFAQRCDHVAQATRFLQDDLNEDTGIALRNLIAAQLDDICEELNRIQKDALNSLESIAQKGRNTQTLFSDHLKNDSRLDIIDAQKDKVSQTSEELTNINNISQSALADLTNCVDQFDGVDAIFLRLDAMREGVRSSSLNADLSERRAEINMPELRSVTKAVGECATSCGRTIEELGRLYKTVHTAFGRVNESSISNAITVVEDVLAVSQAELDALSGQVETIRASTTECSHALSQLTDLGHSAHARIASNVMAAKQLKQIATELSEENDLATINPENVDISILDRIFDSYSIETEREVHRRVVPHIAEKSSEEKGSAQDDDDPLAEFLF